MIKKVKGWFYIMKSNYEIPEISVIYFENEDIVTSSGTTLAGIASSGGFSDNDILWDQLNK